MRFDHYMCQSDYFYQYHYNVFFLFFRYICGRNTGTNHKFNFQQADRRRERPSRPAIVDSSGTLSEGKGPHLPLPTLFRQLYWNDFWTKIYPSKTRTGRIHCFSAPKTKSITSVKSARQKKKPPSCSMGRSTKAPQKFGRGKENVNLLQASVTIFTPPRLR